VGRGLSGDPSPRVKPSDTEAVKQKVLDEAGQAYRRFRDAKVIRKFGDVPEDASALG
jgi:hypothetical protein